MRRTHQRAMAVSFFVIVISYLNFARLTNSDCIRAIHVLTLLVCGMGIGVFLSNLFALIFKKKKEAQ